MAPECGYEGDTRKRIKPLLASREWRLDKALLSFAEFRGGLRRQLRETAEKLIDGEVLALDDVSKDPPPELA